MKYVPFAIQTDEMERAEMAEMTAVNTKTKSAKYDRSDGAEK
jgi:hypothetical protein